MLKREHEPTPDHQNTQKWAGSVQTLTYTVSPQHTALPFSLSSANLKSMQLHSITGLRFLSGNLRSTFSKDVDDQNALQRKSIFNQSYSMHLKYLPKVHVLETWSREAVLGGLLRDGAQ